MKRRLLRLLWQLPLAVMLLWLSLIFVYMLPFISPPSTLMLKGWLTGQPVKREWLELNHMSTALIRSAIAAEDARFCEHAGVDWQALRSVAADAIEGERPRGASTITMQTAKNLFLWPSRSYVRKALEIPLALTLDALWSKQRIMEVYLNIAELGKGGIYGVQAGAQLHYGSSARWLTESKSARLIAILPSPKKRSPNALGSKVAAHARRIENRAANARTDCVLPQ